MKLYVAGFLFNNDATKVALVEKKKFPPGVDWSANPLNGIGGKVELGEGVYPAMVREFKEETSVETNDQWHLFLELMSPTWSVYFYKAFNSRLLNQVRTIEEEKIVTMPVNADTLSLCVPNLKWILPLATYKDAIMASVHERA